MTIYGTPAPSGSVCRRTEPLVEKAVQNRVFRRRGHLRFLLTGISFKYFNDLSSLEAAKAGDPEGFKRRLMETCIYLSECVPKPGQ